MYDRVPASGQEGRVKITPEGGGAAYYATLEMADNPSVAGTPLNKLTLLTDAVAALYGLDAAAVPNDVFNRIFSLLSSDLVVEKITASQIWTAPAAIAQRFRIYGVGGGGGASTSSSSAAGGGGGYITIVDTTIPAGTTVNVVCGAGGAIGSDGGTSSFGAYASAAGGKRGSGNNGGNGGAGGGAANSSGGKGGNGGTYGGGGGGGGSSDSA